MQVNKLYTRRHYENKQKQTQKKSARQVEQNLVQGVNNLMRQERNNRMRMYNDWKMMYSHGKQIFI